MAGEGISGKGGTVKLTGTPVDMLDVIKWTIDRSVSVPKYNSNKTSGHKKGVAGVADTKGTIEIKIPATTGVDIQPGDNVIMQLHIDAGGANYYSIAEAIIAGQATECDIDNGEIVSATYPFEASDCTTNGALAESMSKHQRTAGKDFVPLEIDGTEYRIRPLKVGTYAEMEAFIVAGRGDPLAIASEAVLKLPVQHHEAIWAAAMKQAVTGRTVTAQEASDFENSIEGLSWKAWQCLRDDHPDIDSPEAARDLITRAGKDRLREITLKLEIGSGEADLGNSSGPATTTGETDQAGQ